MCSLPGSKVSTSSPLLCTSLKGHPPDFKSLICTANTDSSFELNIRSDDSEQRHCKNQGVRRPLPGLNGEPTKTQILYHSQGSPLHKMTSSHSCCPGNVSEFGEDQSWKEQIFDFISKQILLYKSQNKDLKRQGSSCAVIQHCTNATGQALEQDDLEYNRGTSELFLNSIEKYDTSASAKDLTENQHVMLEDAAPCKSNEATSPAILPAVSGVTLSEETEKYPRLTVSWSSREECKRVKKTPGTLTLLSRHVGLEREDISLKPGERQGLNDMQGVIDGNQDGNINKQNSLTDETDFHNARSGTMNQSKTPVCNQTSYGNLEDASYVCLQTDLSFIPQPINGNDNTFFVTVLKDPKYEDISDADDLAMLDVNLPNPKQDEVRVADPPYEDISEDENVPFQNIMAKEMTSLSCEMSEANIKQCGHVQVQAKLILNVNKELNTQKQMSSPKMETLDLEQYCSCPCFVETDEGFERVLCPKCDSEKPFGWQTNHSFSPLSVSQDQDESDKAGDEDDEWLVIPLSVLDIKWETADEYYADPKKDQQDYTLFEVPRPVPSPVPASAFSQMEVFDTPFHQAKAVQFGETALQSFLLPSSSGVTDIKANGSQDEQSLCEPEDGCETEDSSDYSSDSEHNYLTVSRQLFKKLSATASPEADDSLSENEAHELTNFQPYQHRRRRESTKKDDIIDLDSDTEDEDAQNCAKTKAKERLSSIDTVNSGTALYSQQTRQSPEIVKSTNDSSTQTVQTSGLPPKDSPATQSLSRCSEEVTQDGNSHISYTTEKFGHLFENEIGMQNVKEVSTPHISDEQSFIIISDTDDDEHQGNRQMKKGIFSSRSTSDGNISCGGQNKGNKLMESLTTETREPSVSSADSKSQHQSKLQRTQLQEKRRDVRFNPLHSMNNRKRIKVRLLPEHVQRKASGQKTSKTMDRQVENPLIKQNTKTRVLSRETEDSDDALGDAQNGPSSDVREKQLQTVDGDNDSTLGPNPVISRLFVQNSSQSSARLKLLNQSTDQRLGTNETRARPKTPAARSKPMDASQKETHLYSEIKGKNVSDRMPIRDVHSSTALSRTTHSSSSPRNLPLSKLQRSHSYINTPKLNQSGIFTRSLSSSASTQLSAKERVFNDHQRSFIPTMRDRKSSLDSNLRTKNNCNLPKEARPGRSHRHKAPRRRHSSHESVPPLMKRTKNEAVQLTKARNRDTPQEQRFSVNEGYKWKNQTSCMANRRQEERYSFLPRPHQ